VGAHKDRDFLPVFPDAFDESVECGVVVIGYPVQEEGCVYGRRRKFDNM
jgi:hypothetical protein